MKKFVPMLLIVATISAVNVYASDSGMMSCPPDYFLRIDPSPKAAGDPANVHGQTPLSELEKQQAEEKAKADEMGRWHCVPMSAKSNSQ